MQLPVLLLFVMLTLSVQAADPPLNLIQTIPLTGVQGRFDHFAIDAAGNRLFVAALGNNTLEVVDLTTGQRIRSLSGMAKPTGVLYLRESNQLLVANGDDGTLKILSGTDFKLHQNLAALADADNLRIDPKTKLAWLGYGEGALAIIEPANVSLVATVKLPAHPESFQLEASSRRLYVNLPDATKIAVIDREKHAVIETWPMEKFRANFPMALDEPNHRLFIGCRQPARLVVLDSRTGKAVTDLAISGDVDDLFLNGKRKQIYLTCGEGFVDIISQLSPDKYEQRAKIATSPGARTGYFSTELDRLYLAVPVHGTQSAEIRVYAPR